MNLHSTTNDEISEDLVPALIKCFGIIFIGYIFGRFQIIPNHYRKGLDIFVQNLALPVLIFNLVATISFGTVNWIFVASVFVTKTAVFFAVAFISMILMKSAHIGKAGLYGIVASQSNDFALGYPLLVSLYRNSHSNYSSFLYLAAPIQVLIVNPVGFIMMEMHKQMQSDSSPRKNPFFTIIKGTFSNPIVAMTMLGLIWNFAFNHTIPLAFGQMLDTISNSFSATALLLLGHSMTGKISTFKGYFVLTPVLLILVKNIIFPIILQKMIVLLSGGLETQETQDLSSLGFLYGTIPSGPAVFVFACQYDLSVDIIASTIIFSTLSSAPIMFVSATMSTLSLHGFEKVTLYMEKTISYLGLISTVACLWLLVLFIIGKKWSNTNYGATTYLVLSQLLVSVGGFLCFFRSPNNRGLLYAQYIMASGGILSTRIWTAFLAVLLLVSYRRNVHFILRAKYAISIAGFVGSFGIAFLLAGSLLSYKTPTANLVPYFMFGYVQVLLTAVVTFLCLLITVICLALQHKYRKTVKQNSKTSESTDDATKITDIEQNATTNYGSLESHGDVNTGISKNNGGYDLLEAEANVSNVEMSCDKCGLIDTESTDGVYIIGTSTNPDISTFEISSDLRSTHTDEERRLNENNAKGQNEEVIPEGSDRILGHMLLLIVLSLSMVVTISVCVWKLTKEATDGIFVELEFLDIALTYGQGIIYFLIFGFDSTVIRPFVKLWRRMQSWCSSFPSRSSSSNNPDAW